MAYTNEVTSILVHSPDKPQLEVEIWEGRHVIEPGDQVEWDDLMVHSVVVDGTHGQFSTHRGPAAAITPLWSIGLKIRLAGHNGVLFRSGYFETLPPPAPEDPNGFISIVQGNQVEITPEQIAEAINTELGPLPAALPEEPGTTLTNVVATPQQGSLRIDASGTTLQAGAALGFDYTVDLQLSAADWMQPAPSAVLGVGYADPGAISFHARSAPDSATVALLANLFRSVVVGPVASRVRSTVQESANAAALTSAATLLGLTPGTGLPQGVVISASRVRLTPAGVAVVPALGCFGSLASKLQSAGASQLPCPFTQLVATAPTVHAIRVDPLRRLRDETLLPTPGGPELVAFYYRHSNVLSILLRYAASRALLGLALRLAQRAHLSSALDVVGRCAARMQRHASITRL